MWKGIFSTVLTGIIPQGFLFQSMAFSKTDAISICRTALLKPSPENLKFFEVLRAEAKCVYYS